MDEYAMTTVSLLPEGKISTILGDVMKTTVRFSIGLSVMAAMLTISFTASLHAQEDVRLASVTLSAPTVIGGNSVEGRVTLNKPAPEVLEVTMAVDPFNAAQVAVSVTVKQREVRAPFKMSTAHGRALVGGADQPVGLYANYEVAQHVKLIIRPCICRDKIMDRVIDREHAFMDNLKQLHPLAETYIQNMSEDPQHNVTPTSDAYFFGRLDLVTTTEEATFK